MTRAIIPTLLLLSILFLVAFAPLSAALGVSYNRQAVLVSEGGEGCATYYVYNSDETGDISVQPQVVGELENVILPLPSEPVTVPANTPVAAAVPIEFCFEVAEGVYGGDCSIEPVDYIGSVIIAQVPESDGGSGSDVSVGVAAPLTVRAGCIEQIETPTTDRGLLFYLYPLIVIILAVAIVVMLIRRSKEPTATTMTGAK